MTKIAAQFNNLNGVRRGAGARQLPEWTFISRGDLDARISRIQSPEFGSLGMRNHRLLKLQCSIL